MSLCDFQLYLKKLTNGEPLSGEEALVAAHAPLDELSDFAFQVQKNFAPSYELCAIVNGKSGHCSEDCRYCAQSSFFKTTSECYSLKDEKFLDKAFSAACGQELNYFSVVTSGRSLSADEVRRLASAYRRWSASGCTGICCSHGLLGTEEFRILATAGVSRYHCNLETSRRYFPYVCTTHSYDDKIRTIREAQAAGLEVCSGGIIGMGETWQDRADMALELRRLGIRSVPLNFLSPISGTAFESLSPPVPETAYRVFALFRMLLPDAFLCLSGGRSALPEAGIPLFAAGANAAITGDLLTTSGGVADSDRAAIADVRSRLLV